MFGFIFNPLLHIVFRMQSLSTRPGRHTRSPEFNAFSSAQVFSCHRIRFCDFLVMETSMFLQTVCYFLYLRFCPTKLLCAVRLTPLFISVTTFSKSSHRCGLAPNSEVLSLAENMFHDSSKPIKKSSVKALCCLWTGGEMAASTLHRPFPRKRVSSLKPSFLLYGPSSARSVALFSTYLSAKGSLISISHFLVLI